MLFTCHTHYSLRYGLHSPETMATALRQRGVDTFVLADINNTSAISETWQATQKEHMQMIAGMTLRPDKKNSPLCIAMAKNQDGLREINTYYSQFPLRGLSLPSTLPQFQNAFTLIPLEQWQGEPLTDNTYLLVQAHQLNILVKAKFQNIKEKLIAWHPIVFLHPGDEQLHWHLRAIDHNTLLTKLPQEEIAANNPPFASVSHSHKAFASHTYLIRQAEKLVAQCQFAIPSGPKNKQEFTDSAYHDKLLLERLAYEGLTRRYGKNNAEARQRVDKELHIINKLGFSAYFLITHDMITFSQHKGFQHVGRGSGANSVVAFCLGITDVDPIELDLYFERFINPRRTSPPDFDIDYAWNQRDYVLDYLFARYPNYHVALLGTISTFKGKSIVRELGKVQGLPKEEIDEMITHPGKAIREDHLVRNIYAMANRLANLPNMRSIHAGGVLITQEPITNYTALDLPPKGYPTTQWDMYSAEELGFEKLDVLSQRGIGHINDAVKYIEQNHNKKVPIHNVKAIKEDQQVKNLLSSGETTGCFYIESPAMRGLLSKLQCRDYLTLVAASSIIRPGVAKSGMMKTYIERFHNPGSFTYIHPVMEQQLSETYGVMVYQEDVLKVCHHFADLDLADADILRRAMSGKYRSKKEFKRIEEKFFDNCKSRGYDDSIVREVWRQIESFAGYSFSKAHSASYATESFQSLYLKAYYPLEFITAVINNFGGFYATSVYVNEARRLGAHIELPDANHSQYVSSIKGNTLHLGFVHIKDLESKLAHRIIAERQKDGHYKSLKDFVFRTALSREQATLLIRMNALRTTGLNKMELLWQLPMLYNQKQQRSYEQPALFQPREPDYQLPELSQTPLEDAYDEIELLGFPVTLTPFDMLQTSFRGQVRTQNLNQYVGKKVKLVGELVTIKYVRTVKKEIMNFGCFKDAEGNLFDTVHFPNSLNAHPFQGQGVYLLLGKVVEDFGYPGIEIEKMARLPLKPDPRSE
ncbi:MAG: DNA polymerase III subunit alpha [Bacteroidales bacterium]